MAKYYSFFDKIMADSYLNPRFLSFPLHHLNRNYRHADSIYDLFWNYFNNFIMSFFYDSIYHEYYFKNREKILSRKVKS